MGYEWIRKYISVHLPFKRTLSLAALRSRLARKYLKPTRAQHSETALMRNEHHRFVSPKMASTAPMRPTAPDRTSKISFIRVSRSFSGVGVPGVGGVGTGGGAGVGRLALDRGTRPPLVARAGGGMDRGAGRWRRGGVFGAVGGKVPPAGKGRRPLHPDTVVVGALLRRRTTNCRRRS